MISRCRTEAGCLADAKTEKLRRNSRVCTQLDIIHNATIQSPVLEFSLRLKLASMSVAPLFPSGRKGRALFLYGCVCWVKLCLLGFIA